MILICYQFLMIFVAVQTTHPVISMVGTPGLFILYSLVCLTKTLVVGLFVPETFGKTYQEVREQNRQQITISAISIQRE